MRPTHLTPTHTVNLGLFLMFFLSATPAHAYIGPGLGVGGMIVVLVVILSLILAFYAIVWFPIKRRLKAKSEAKQAQVDQADS